MNSEIVSPEWLVAHLGDPKLIVLDGSWYLPGKGRNSRTEFESAHIPGARFFDLDRASDPSSSLPHTLPPAAYFADYASELGVSNDSELVVYDGSGTNLSASRVWWMFRTFGHRGVAVLDGGFSAWQRAGGTTQSGVVSRAKTSFVAQFRHEAVSSIELVSRALESGAATVVDVRSAGRFSAKEPEPRPGLPSGHMPGALNLPFDELVAKDGTVLPETQLREKLEAAKVPLDKPVIATCGSGTTACNLVLALERLGYSQVSVFDGSWTEWASSGRAIAIGKKRRALDRSRFPDLAVLQARKRMNDAVRGFFDTRGFLEVETPIGVVSPGIEPHLRAFETRETGPDGSEERLYLHTSPEYAMKKLLGGGVGSIYQIARVFRDGERSSTHTPEFTMLEWYRAPGELQQVMDDAEKLILAVAHAVAGRWVPKASRRVSVSDAFVRAGLVDPISETSAEKLALGCGIRFDPTDSWDDVFFKAFFKSVEPTFDPGETTTLYGYPAAMAALSRLNPGDPRVAERFEVYCGPIELANAFGELSDPIEQRARFQTDLEQRAAARAPIYPIDEDLLKALPNMGTAAGIALGLDRLLMLCLGVSDIADVVCFAPR